MQCELTTQPKPALGHELPIRLSDWHVRSYVNCGRAKTKGRYSSFGPGTEIRVRCYLPSMKLADVNAVTAAVASWAIERNDIRAMAMLGSWVRGNPRPDSDLDLLLLSDLAPDYQRSKTWLTAIDFQNAGFRLQSTESAFYGVVWSQHLHLLPAAEVELTFARCSWASTDPVDIGTRVIVKDAFQIIFDRDGILTKLVDAVM